MGLTETSKVVSITFDDGFRNAAVTATPILSNYGYRASFYVVSGWVEPRRAAVSDPYNRGQSHGTWDFWRRISAMGHEIGSHTFSHLNARGRKAAIFPWLMPRDIMRSVRDLRREVPSSRYTISMPWNAASVISDHFVRRHFSACLSGTSELRYNDLKHLSNYALVSWAPGPKHSWRDYVDAIERVPAGGWLVLQFHSFGDEGWEPITAALFTRICDLLAENRVTVKPVANVVNELSQ